MQAMSILAQPTRYLFFTGKGGVGKTSLACATAVELAERGRHVLLVSTDPASNLDQVLETPLASAPTPVVAVPRLAALNIDPETAAQAYRERALSPYRGQIAEEAMQQMEEQLAGACTVEIAAFDQFAGLLAGSDKARPFDHIIFDTAPTGHTLRLLRLAAAWSGFLELNPDGTSCLGPTAGLHEQQVRYEAAVAALGDPTRTTLVLVTRPERSALTEAERTAADLRGLGMTNQHLVINGVFAATNRADRIAVAMEQRGQHALAAMPPTLRVLPRTQVPLKGFNVVGIDAIKELLDNDAPTTGPALLAPSPSPLDVPPLASLVDDLATADRGLVMVMGKGGVGKTTIAAAIAVALTNQGRTVHLTTTDPAAHVASTVEEDVPHLTASRIDPAAETRAYTERVLAGARKRLDPEALALLEEDLRSPCTEEVAVFHAFSRIVSRARSDFVVLDTAPTGHTLMLLDATGAYHHEVMRSLAKQEGLSGAVTPLMNLRNPGRTKVVIVTLAETTPVVEATQLQDDLRRAGIEPYAWIINSSLAATGTHDPLLTQRASAELNQIATVRDEVARRVYLVPWQIDEPVGAARLRDLTGVQVEAELIATDR